MSFESGSERAGACQMENNEVSGDGEKNGRKGMRERKKDEGRDALSKRKSSTTRSRRVTNAKLCIFLSSRRIRAN